MGAGVCRMSPSPLVGGGLGGLVLVVVLVVLVASLLATRVVAVDWVEMVLALRELSGVMFREARMLAMRGEMAQRRGRG